MTTKTPTEQIFLLIDRVELVEKLIQDLPIFVNTKIEDNLANASYFANELKSALKSIKREYELIRDN